MSHVDIRNAVEGDVESLTTLWYDGWRDAHLRIVPPELTRIRTHDNFRERLRARLADVRVIGPTGSPLRFVMLNGDELYQFYVSASARGTGVAATLMADAEARLRERGVTVAWLACAVGNDRAARFYEKCGWRRAATVTIDPPESERAGPPVVVWRYEQSLAYASFPL